MDPNRCEDLDIDDSDLSNFIRPCQNRSNTSAPSPTLIPGPAGAFQAAMIHRRSAAGTSDLTTQQFVRRVLQDGHDTNLDFVSNAWLSANQEGEHATPLIAITPFLEDPKIVPCVVAVIKSFTPNGFRDAMVTLKDPTGTIDASIHRKVFTEIPEGGEISEGSALLLGNVAVFCPNRNKCYLNITLTNVLKIFPKECGPPPVKG